jgi:hypothetical protein
VKTALPKRKLVLRWFCCRVGKILRLRQKLMSVKDSVTGLFGGGKDASSDKFDAFKGEPGKSTRLSGCAGVLRLC